MFMRRQCPSPTAGIRGKRCLRAIALTAATVAAVLVTAAAPVGARTTATQIGGSWSITSGAVVEQRQLGQLLYLRQQGTSVFTGGLVGTTAFDLRVFLRPDFSSFGWATEPFTGSFDGRSGGFEMLEWATGAADGSVRIDALVGNGTGALRGIRGHITFVSNLCLPESCEGTYSGLLTG